jgi:hypothetical protein
LNPENFFSGWKKRSEDWSERRVRTGIGTEFLGLRSDRKRINDSEDEPKNEKFRSNTGQRFGTKIYVIVKDLVLAIAEGDVEEFCLGA